jgi:hypothetical protein
MMYNKKIKVIKKLIFSQVCIHTISLKKCINVCMEILYCIETLHVHTEQTLFIIILIMPALINIHMLLCLLYAQAEFPNGDT